MAEKRLKIAIFNYYQNSVNRGAERFVKELAEYLSNFGHKIDIFFEDKPSFVEKNSLLKRFFLDNNSLRILFFTLTKSSNLIYDNYDIVIPINGGWQPFIIKFFSLFKRFKIVISGQSGKGWDDRVNLTSFPDLFIATSNYQKKWASKTNIFVNSIYIPNGINVEEFNKNKDKIKTNLSKPIVITVGALVPEKRIDLVINAVSKTNASLLIIGDGYLKNEIKNLCDQKLKDRYEIKKLNFEEMKLAYKTADLFVLTPQPTESFGIVFLEAMASGLGIVTQKDKIREEIVGDAGLFINPNNIEEFVEALNKALKVDWKNKPLEQAYKFDWKVIAKRYEEELLKLCKK